MRLPPAPGGGATIALDLGGTEALPSVEGLQGEDLPDSVADTLLKRNTTNTGWETVTYTGSNLSTDLAAKASSSHSHAESDITSLVSDLAAKALAATQVIAGAGLTGGGTLAADRTINMVANADGSLVVNADDVQVGVLASDAQHGTRGGGTVHANAVAAGAAGFMTGADKTKSDGLAALTTKGDLLGFSTVPTRIAVGSDNSVWTADSSNANGAKWTAIFDNTNPAALGTVGPGTALIAARRDHVHANPAIDTLAAATDITTLNASTTAHGLLKKLSNSASEYMNGAGNWATPSGGVSATNAADTRVPYWDGTTGLTAGAALTFNGTKLIAAGNSQGAVTVGSVTGSNSVQLRGGATNTGELFMAGGTDHFVTGAASGDIGLACYTNTQKIHISAGGGTQVIIDGNSGTPTFSLGGLDLIKIKGCTLSWPSANAAGLLTNNGSGTLSWATPAIDTLGAATDITTRDASTTAHGLAPKAVAPASGLLSVLAIGNGATAYSVTALFDTTNPAALGTVGPGTALVAARRDHIHANPAIDTLAAATDITTLNASTTAHGLLKKLSNVSTEFMNGVGSWATPAASLDITGQTAIAAGIVEPIDDEFPLYDVSATANRKGSIYNAVFDMHRRFYLFEHCLNATFSSDWAAPPSGTYQTGTQGHPGIFQMAVTGNGLILGNRNVFLLGGTGNHYRFGTWIKLSALSTAGASYFIYAGFHAGQTNNSAAANGVYWVYNHGTSSGNWTFRCNDNGSVTDTDSTIAADTNWVFLEVEVNGSTWVGYINGTQRVSGSTNVPTTTGREVGAGVTAYNPVGSPTANLQVDCIGVMAHLGAL